MSYDSLYFYFVFYSDIPNSGIVQKLISICSSSISSQDVDHFREYFSCILDYHDVFGISKKNYVLDNKAITVLFGSFSEDLFLYNILYYFVRDTLGYNDYSDSDCYLSIEHLKYGFANKFIAFAYNPNSCDLQYILSRLSKTVIENDFSGFATPFYIVQRFLSDLNQKILSIPIPEKDLRICQEYFNLSSLLSSMFFQTIPSHPITSDVMSHFEASASFLVNFGIVSSEQEFKMFYSFDLKTQITILNQWQTKFRSSISNIYSWEELFLIVSFLCSFSSFKRDFFISKRNEDGKPSIVDLFEQEVHVSQKDRVFLYNLSLKKFQEWIDFVPTIVSDNFQLLLNFFDYSNNLITDFISKSKNLLPKGFEIMLENVTNQFIDCFDSRYVLQSITDPIDLKLAT